MTMQAAVLWVYQKVRGPAGITLESGQRPALCFKGRKYMCCVLSGHPVRILKREASEFGKMREVQFHGLPYEIERAAAQLRVKGKENGITASAKRLLSLVGESKELPEDELHDEEDLAVETTPENGVEGPAPETPAPTPEPKAKANGEAKPKAKKAKAVKEGEPKLSQTGKAINRSAAKAAEKGEGKKADAAKPKKDTKPKKAKEPKEKGPSKISQAVDFMRKKVEKTGGADKMAKDAIKKLYEETSQKFGLMVSTCQTQYGRHIKIKRKKG